MGVAARLVAVEHRIVHHRGRLAGRYPAVAAMVVFALVPYLALSAAVAAADPDPRASSSTRACKR